MALLRLIQDNIDLLNFDTVANLFASRSYLETNTLHDYKQLLQKLNGTTKHVLSNLSLYNFKTIVVMKYKIFTFYPTFFTLSLFDST